MSESKPANPVLITGMHRSGTSILARLLSQSGVWLGSDSEPRYLESLFFLETNESLLSLADSAWHQPRDFLLALASPEQLVARGDRVRATCCRDGKGQQC